MHRQLCGLISIPMCACTYLYVCMHIYIYVYMYMAREKFFVFDLS